MAHLVTGSGVERVSVVIISDGLLGEYPAYRCLDLDSWGEDWPAVTARLMAPEIEAQMLMQIALQMQQATVLRLTDVLQRPLP